MSSNTWWFDLSFLGGFRGFSFPTRQRNEEGLGYEPFMAWTDKMDGCAKALYQLAHVPPSNPHPSIQKVDSEHELQLNLDGV